MLEINNIYNIDCLEGLKSCPIPNLIICDPPYDFETLGAGIAGMRELYKDIKEANLNKFDFDKFIIPIIELQKDKVNAYFFTNKKILPKYLNLAIERGLNYDILTLNKKAPIPCKEASYLPEIEYIVFLRSPNAYFNGKLDYKLYFKSYFCYTNGVSNKHPTQKPLDLIKKFIKLSSKENDLVLDCFLGSGTTALASKQLNRNYLGFEINKEYFRLAADRLNYRELNEYLK